MDKKEAREFFNNLTGNLVVLSDGEKYIELGCVLDIVDRIEPEKACGSTSS